MVKRLGGAVFVLMASMGFVLAPAVVQPAAASPPTRPDIQCGVPITTSVRLRHNLTCASQVTTQTDMARSITIDLHGHTLTVTSPGPCTQRELAFPVACGLVTFGGPVTIEDGTVVGGIGSPAPFSPRDAPISAGGLIRHVTVDGTVFLDGVTEKVTRSDVKGSIQTNGRTSTIADSTVDGFISGGNLAAGLSTDPGATVRIVRNRVIGDGLFVGANSQSPLLTAVIDHNSVTDASEAGMLILGASNGLGKALAITVTHNTITRSKAQGMQILDSFEGLASSTVSSNTVTGSGLNGIELVTDDVVGRTPQVFTFRNNTADGNAEHGISLADANMSIVSGTHNRATGNAVDPQCVGVSCDPHAPALPPVQWMMPDQITFGAPLGPDQLNATSLVPGTFTYDPPAGTVLGATTDTADGHQDPPHTLTATFVPRDRRRFQTVTLTRMLSVAGAVPVVTWPTPADIVMGTPLGPDQLNATASLPGTFTYTPPAGTVLGLGLQQLLVTFHPDDAANYRLGFVRVNINVAPP